METHNSHCEDCEDCPECPICLEQIEQTQTKATPEPCKHCFHVICISIWLKDNNTCPVCRRKIEYDAKINWTNIITLVYVFNQQQLIERALCAFTFLDHILQEYRTAQDFKNNIDKILHTIEHFQTTSNIRLPFMAIPTRSDAIKEKRKWRESAETLLESKITKERLQTYRDTIQQWI